MDSKCILVVDDEAHILHVVSLKLKNAGFCVLTARCAEEAMELAVGQAVDLVITDYHMPEITGLELAKMLRRDLGRADLPVLMLTAHELALDRVMLAEAGIVTCLSKPFSPREILQRVIQTLGLNDASSPV